ncbi:MAG: LuxR family transcriptional regulator [Berryella intestinalis]|uniref:LuxR family transcriptional regulator n=1 Tax=Berryella intestinalis TaxID=1531429 RepID=UPI002A55F22C|nr:LuxR family transcriptional regulator [Berryella intestinalis]MDD7369588.1 LuxR family transcriptional regulator [Berryella intestinalis]MDY3129811.1 LuxR family transcriptional regulator [Berryella intestinalis]
MTDTERRPRGDEAFVRDLMDATAIDGASTAMVFPLRFLGASLLIAWLCCTHIVEVFPVTGAHDLAARNMGDLFMRIGDISTFVVLAIAAPRIGSLACHRHALWALSGITSAGTAICGFVLIPGSSGAAALALGSVVTAVGGAVLFCTWAQIYSRMGATQTVVYGAASCIAAMLVSLGIVSMKQPVALALTSILPLLCAACALAGQKLVAPEAPWKSDVRFPMPWKLIALMIIAAFMSGLCGLLLSNQTGGAIHRVLATGLAGVALLGMAFVLRERFDARLLAKVSLPLALIALVSMPFAGSEFGALVSMAAKFAYVWFTLFVLLLLANIARRFEVPALRMFAIVRACSEAAILAGVVAKRSIWEFDLHYDQAFLFGLFGGFCGRDSGIGPAQRAKTTIWN